MQNLAMGFVAGALLGAVAGSAIEHDYNSVITGALIGVGVVPILSDQIRCRINHFSTPEDKLFLYAGVNAAASNHARTILKPGYSIAFGKYFKLSRIHLLTGCSLNHRRFKLEEQKIKLIDYERYTLGTGDLVSSVYSIDLTLMPSLRRQIGTSTTLFISPGLVVVMPIDENSELAGATAWISHDIHVEAQFSQTINRARTMSYVDDLTRWSTYQLSFGFQI